MRTDRDMTVSGQVWRFCVFFILWFLILAVPTGIFVYWFVGVLNPAHDRNLVFLGHIIGSSGYIVWWIFKHREDIGLPILSAPAVRATVYVLLGVGCVLYALGFEGDSLIRTVIALVFIAVFFRAIQKM